MAEYEASRWKLGRGNEGFDQIDQAQPHQQSRGRELMNRAQFRP